MFIIPDFNEAREVRYEYLSDTCAEVCGEIIENLSFHEDTAIAMSKIWHYMCLACISLKYNI